MDIVKWILAGLAILGTCFEIAPIKINPISFIFKWIGNKLMAEVIEQLKEVQNKVNALELQAAQDEVDKIKSEILKFGKSCRNKEKHTQKQFEQIIYLNKKYEDLVKKYNIDNGVLEIEYEYILSIYKRCQHEGTFL